uniref:SFRICE_021544 n=1 Tax=Spodoptera frugiperda TaxID=7108 RepID=A0A2H1W5I0_SPOFR
MLSILHTVAVCPAWADHRQVLRDVVGDGDLSRPALVQAMVRSEGACDAVFSFCEAVMLAMEDPVRAARCVPRAPQRAIRPPQMGPISKSLTLPLASPKARKVLDDFPPSKKRYGGFGARERTNLLTPQPSRETLRASGITGRSLATVSAGLRTASKGNSPPDQYQTDACGASRSARASKSHQTTTDGAHHSGNYCLLPNPYIQDSGMTIEPMTQDSTYKYLAFERTYQIDQQHTKHVDKIADNIPKHHPISCVQRITLLRDESGRDLIDVQNLHNQQIINLRNFFMHKSQNSSFHKGISQIDRKYTPLNVHSTDRQRNEHITSKSDKIAAWTHKSLHGRHRLDLQQPHVDMKVSNAWLQRVTLP